MKELISTNIIHIKNMVCNRCIAAVARILEDAGIQYQWVALGEVLLTEKPSAKQTALFKEKLAETGFVLLDDDKSKTINKIKTIIIELVRYNSGDAKYNLSAILSSKVHKDYTSLSRLFSDVEDITIEKYSINQKIERIKELLAYGEMNLNEIAFQLGYSSVAHLSGQFKKVTGLTPSYFKRGGGTARKPLDAI